MTVANDITGTTEGCRYCWMCRQACPVGHVTRRETLTPHGWGMLIASERRGVVSWTPEVTDAMYSCADCGLCQAHCATGQPLPDAIAAARASIVAAGAAPAAVTELHARLERWGNPYGEVQPLNAASRETATSEVALFAGDAAVAGGADTLTAALTLLASIGIHPAVVGDGQSNGHLASALGYPETARAQAADVVAEVVASKCREVLVLTPGDRFAFERLYGERLGVAWPADVAIREVTSVLAAALAEGRLALPAVAEAGRPWAYHDPCHTARVARDHDAPRALLRAALGANSERRLFWREGRAHPCGATGGLEFTQPAIAAQLAAARFRDAADAGASLLVTEDPSCLRHLRQSAPSGVDVLGLYEALTGRGPA
jgi:Fe-S oxidoreductase